VTVSRFTGREAVIPAAMLAVSSPFVQRALDLATDSDGALVLITERTKVTLSALLELRGTLRLGEAVTILAPVASGVQALHREGFTHGGPSPATIAFTPDGRPLVMLMSDSSSLSPTEHQPSTLLSENLADLKALVALVLERSDGAGGEPVAALLRWLERVEPRAPSAEIFTQLELRLFALAEPAPVSFTVQQPGKTESPAAPSFAVRPRPRMGTKDAGAGDTQRFLAGFGLESLGEAVDGFSLTQETRARLVGAGGWLTRAMRGRAAVLSVGTAVAMLALWGGLALVPSTETPTSAADRQSSAERATEVAVTDAEQGAIESDDPAAALLALLAVRSRCLQSGQRGCLALVDESDSAAEATDRHVMSAKGEAFLPLPITPEKAEILQRTGNAVLFRVPPDDTKNQPVLVLVMKTNTGWRLRDLSVPG
jgi:hypothetical protein